MALDTTSPTRLHWPSLLGATAGVSPAVVFVIVARFDLALACGAAIVVGVGALQVERTLTGRRRWAWIGLAGIGLSAALALATDSATTFFVRSVALRAACGIALLGSVAVGRPAVGVLSAWVLPARVARQQASTHHRAFVVVTLVWGLAQLAKAVVRGYVMVTGSLDSFTVVLLATGYPVEALLAVFSLWYLRRAGVSIVEAPVDQ